MTRKMFCEISPVTYRISVYKSQIIRYLSDYFSMKEFCFEKSNDFLPILIHKHNSLIRRRLGNVDMALQENKAINLKLASHKINRILIKPGEYFSFWSLVGSVNSKKGYKTGLTIANSKVSSGVGGGLCQLTNLIHWMVLHTPLEITEHHHHDGFDLFPDYNRQIPFGTGTSIYYNYLDYRFYNPTDITFQLIIYTTDDHLCGELRADKYTDYKYHIKSENEHFIKENNIVYRKGQVYIERIDRQTGKIISKDLIRQNHAKVMYDTKDLVVL